MAYTRPWNPSQVLLGSRDADEIDDALRDFARDLDERFRDVIKDVHADPWQLNALGGGGALAKQLIHAGGGMIASGGEMHADGYIRPTGGAPGTAVVFFPLKDLPAGATLTSVSLVSASDLAPVFPATFTLEIWRKSTVVGSTAVQVGTNTGETGAQVLANHVVLEDTLYWAKVTITGADGSNVPKLYGIRIQVGA